MPISKGFYFSFPAACHCVHKLDLLSGYPLRPDGFFTKDINSLDKLLSSPAVQNLSLCYFECFCESLRFLRKYDVYSKSLLESSYLVFTYKSVPLLVFDNPSNEFSHYATVIDMSYLVPHYTTDEKVKEIQCAKQRWATLSLLTGFLAFGFLRSS